jgi:hypothetical protein
MSGAAHEFRLTPNLLTCQQKGMTRGGSRYPTVSQRMGCEALSPLRRHAVREGSLAGKSVTLRPLSPYVKCLQRLATGWQDAGDVSLSPFQSDTVPQHVVRPLPIQRGAVPTRSV